MKKKETTTQEYFSEKFQYEGVRALFESPDLFRKIEKVLDQNCFKDTWLKQVVGTMKDMYDGLGKVPNYNEVELRLSRTCKNEDDLQYCTETIQKIKASDDISLPFAEEELKEFFRQKYRFAAVQNFIADKDFSDKKVEKLMKKLIEASDAGSDECIATSLTDEALLAAFTEGESEVIPTYINGLDKWLNRGLRKGQLGLCMARTGWGKTTFSRVISHNAAINGHKSLYIYFEDTPEEMVRFAVARTADVNVHRLQGMTENTALRSIERFNTFEEAQLLRDNERFCRMPDKKTKVEDIRKKVREYINDGFRPDVLIIDYFACLNHNGNGGKKSYEAEAENMKLLINIAMEYDMALWVMQQTNRSAFNENMEPSAEQWMGSYEATTPATIFLQIDRRKDNSIAENRADLYIHKVRGNGEHPDVLEDIVFDNGRAYIDCSTGTTLNEQVSKIFNENEEFKPTKFQFKDERQSPATD